MALSNGASAASAAAAAATGAEGKAATAAATELDEESDSEDCEVECIVTHRLRPEQYLVRWVGFPPSEDSWLTREELRDTAAELLREYLDKVKEVELQIKPCEIFLDVEAVDADKDGDDEEEEEDEEERGRRKKKQKKLQQQSNKDDDADGEI